MQREGPRAVLALYGGPYVKCSSRWSWFVIRETGTYME